MVKMLEWNMAILLALLVNIHVVASASELFSFGPPLLLWPLSNNTYLSEVRQGKPQNNRQCGLEFDTSVHTFLHCQPLKFDGHTRPYVDLLVELSSGQTSLKAYQVFFAFSFNAIKATSRGYLMHYRATGSGNDHTEVSIWMETGNTLCLGYVTSGQISSTICVPDVIKPDAWQFVSAGVDLFNGDIRIGIDGPYTVKIDIRLASTKNIEVSGKLRLGSDHKDSQRFQGMLTCLSLYQGPVPYTQKKTILNRCFWGVPVWNVLPTGLPIAPSGEGCHGTKSSDNYYIKHADDVIPVKEETESFSATMCGRMFPPLHLSIMCFRHIKSLSAV